MAAPTRRPSWVRWLVGIIVVVVVLVVGGPFVYFHFIEGKTPAKLSLSTTTTALAPSSGTTSPVNAATSSPLTGTWTVGSGSTAGYRVKETLFGQSHTAVGRTTGVAGTITIVGTRVTKAAFTVDMATITSDSGERDNQFQGRIMDTSEYPTATFTLTNPIDLAPLPQTGVVKDYSATGTLTLHGMTKTVTIPLTAKRTGDVIAVQGILSITFSDYNIDNPSGGPASVGNTGQMEFLVQLQKS